MAPVELLIAGGGSRGATFAGWAARHPERARVVAVAEPREDRREALADAHGVHPDRCFARLARGARQRPGRRRGGRRHARPRAHRARDRPRRAGLRAADREAAGDHGGGVRGDRGGGRARRASWRRSRTCCATRRTRSSCGGCSTRARSATSSASSTSSPSASGTRPTPTCAATGAARTRPARCCWPSAATTSTGSRTWSAARCERGLLVRQPRPPAARAPARRAPATAAWTARSSGPAPTPPAGSTSSRPSGARRAGPSTSSPGRRRPSTSSAALREGPYGRCVWACDNDVVDHQVVSLAYEGGATASLTMTAFTRMRDRETRIFGTRGELRGDGAHGRGLRLPHPHHHAPRRPGRRGPDRPRRRRRRRDGRLRRGGGGRRPGARADHAPAHARVAPDRVRGRDLAPRGPDAWRSALDAEVAPQRGELEHGLRRRARPGRACRRRCGPAPGPCSPRSARRTSTGCPCAAGRPGCRGRPRRRRSRSGRSRRGSPRRGRRRRRSGRSRPGRRRPAAARRRRGRRRRRRRRPWPRRTRAGRRRSAGRPGPRRSARSRSR